MLRTVNLRPTSKVKSEGREGLPAQIVDRSKDMIIRGGFNVYPREIEKALMTQPDAGTV